MLSLTFTQPLNSCYKRVNKSGNKNLRCFPRHSPSGHSDSTYCGQPVIVHVPGSEQTSLEYLAEFALDKSPATAIPASRQLSSGEARPASFFVGQRLGNDLVIFNHQQHGWPYEWVSSRYTGHQLHVFRVYCVEGGNNLVATFDSSPFTVSSLRDKNVFEALGALSSNDPFRLILRAIHDRVATDDADLDFSGLDYDDGDGGGVQLGNPGIFTDNVVLLDKESEERLLAVENLDALLNRIALFIGENFHKWRGMNALKIDCVDFLSKMEGVNVDQVVAELGNVLGIKLLADSNLQPKVLADHSDNMFQLALATARSCLVQGSAICPCFTLNGSNDISGHYRRPEAFLKCMNDINCSFGWSQLDVKLWYIFFFCIN